MLQLDAFRGNQVCGWFAERKTVHYTERMQQVGKGRKVVLKIKFSDLIREGKVVVL